MDVDSESIAIEKAKELAVSDPEKAIVAYKSILETSGDGDTKDQERAIVDLGELFVKLNRGQDIIALSKEARPFFANLPKARASKLVRALIDLLARIPSSQVLQIEMCLDCIKWCTEEKRTFLRLRVQTKLAALYLDDSKYQSCLELLRELLKEVKKLDDKLLLVEIHLTETRVHFAVNNIPKSKAALTASKTNANAIYCPPQLQAEIDMWSGILGAAEKDFNTSYSYFYEAHEAYCQMENEQKARNAMKLMLLAKIMMGIPQEVDKHLKSKAGLRYVGRDIDAMAAVAKAYEERSLKKFENVKEKYAEELGGDPVISLHLNALNEMLLEQNFLKILQPYSHVELSHVAKLIDLPVDRTINKLSQMILDAKLTGTLDQGTGVLIVFDQEPLRSTYDSGLQTINNASDVVDMLWQRSSKLT